MNTLNKETGLHYDLESESADLTSSSLGGLQPGGETTSMEKTHCSSDVKCINFRYQKNLLAFARSNKRFSSKTGIAERSATFSRMADSATSWSRSVQRSRMFPTFLKGRKFMSKTHKENNVSKIKITKYHFREIELTFLSISSSVLDLTIARKGNITHRVSS